MLKEDPDPPMEPGAAPEPGPAGLPASEAAGTGTPAGGPAAPQQPALDAAPETAAGQANGSPLPRRSAAPALPYLADAAQFGSMVHVQLAECRRQGQPLAVLAIAIGAMLPAPDRHAASTRAALLLQVGHRLRSRVRESDSVVRIGRDGFGLVLLGAGDASARIVESRLSRALQEPYRIGNLLVSLRLQTGFAVYPQAGVTGESLALAAERARHKHGV